MIDLGYFPPEIEIFNKVLKMSQRPAVPYSNHMLLFIYWRKHLKRKDLLSRAPQFLVEVC